MTAIAWFRPKRFGYGAVPITWQGWLLTLSSAALVACCVTVAAIAHLQHWPHDRGMIMLCSGLAVVTLIVFAAMARVRTAGNWEWRS